jgi:hypothetical protein
MDDAEELSRAFWTVSLQFELEEIEILDGVTEGL